MQQQRQHQCHNAGNGQVQQTGTPTLPDLEEGQVHCCLRILCAVMRAILDVALQELQDSPKTTSARDALGAVH